MLKKLGTLSLAIAKHVSDGMAKTSDIDYKNRLAVCEFCPYRSKSWVCEKCECYLTVKAGWRSENCPLGLWPGDARPRTEGCRSCGT